MKLKHRPANSSEGFKIVGPLNYLLRTGLEPFPDLKLEPRYREFVASFGSTYDLVFPSWPADEKMLVLNPIIIFLSLFPLALLQSIIESTTSQHIDGLTELNVQVRDWIFRYIHDCILYSRIFSLHRKLDLSTFVYLLKEPLAQLIGTHIHMNKHTIAAEKSVNAEFLRHWTLAFEDICLKYASFMHKVIPKVNAATIDESRFAIPEDRIQSTHFNPALSINNHKPIVVGFEMKTCSEVSSRLLLSFRPVFPFMDTDFEDNCMTYKAAYWCWKLFHSARLLDKPTTVLMLVDGGFGCVDMVRKLALHNVAVIANVKTRSMDFPKAALSLVQLDEASDLNVLLLSREEPLQNIGPKTRSLSQPEKVIKLTITRYISLKLTNLVSSVHN